MPVDEIGPFQGYLNGQPYEDEPYYGYAAYAQWALFCAARDQGVRVMLGGFDGDGVISHGLAYLPELARRGRWGHFLREARALARVHQGSLENGYPRIRPASAYSGVGENAAATPVWVDETQHILTGSPISPACAARTGIIPRLQAAHQANLNAWTSRASHWFGINHGMNAMILETSNIFGYACGIEDGIRFSIAGWSSCACRCRRN